MPSVIDAAWKGSFLGPGADTRQAFTCGYYAAHARWAAEQAGLRALVQFAIGKLEALDHPKDADYLRAALAKAQERL
jgi:hypothetical protein